MNAPRPVVLTLLLGPLLLLSGLAALLRPAGASASRGDHALAAVLPAPDLALPSAARALRMPSLEERWASSHDHPGQLDLDPAGATFLPEPLP